MNVLRVLHIASHEINVGDGALNGAIREGVRRLHSGPVAFDLADVAVFRKELSVAELDSYDLVLVGGGGGISNGPHARRTGTPMPLDLETYRETNTPFAFVGIGHNIFAGQPLKYASALTQLLTEVRRKGDIFSVRNDGSRQRLIRDLGDVALMVREIPDPGFFVRSEVRKPLEAGPRPFALIQVAGDAIADRVRPNRWGGIVGRMHSREAKSMLAEWISQVALHLWNRHGLDILLAPHIHHDVPLCSDIMRRLYAQAGAAAQHRPFRVGGTPHPSHAEEFFGCYRAARLVIGMRGHAVICGIGLRCPTIALSSHPKVGEFLASCNLSAWSVPLGPDAAAALINRSDDLLASDAPYFAARDGAVKDFQERFEHVLLDALALGRARMRRREAATSQAAAMSET